jgi:hypothetical protein
MTMQEKLTNLTIKAHYNTKLSFATLMTVLQGPLASNALTHLAHHAAAVQPNPHTTLILSSCGSK